MDSLPSFKSKKFLRSSGEALETPDQSPWTSKTPEKQAHPPRRIVTHRQSQRSVKQVKEAANQLRKPSISSSPLTSSADSIEIKFTKPNASKLLPEKYEMLNKFFHSLGSSIRLLLLKGSKSTFTNISRQVEILTDRSFGYSHLAQIKFVLPEAIEIKKILVRDDRTSCMKPYLHIGLNLGIVENDEKLTSDSAYIMMNKLFRSRLVRFLKSNPEGDEGPEEMLPEPFNRSNRLTSSNAIQKPDLDSDQDITYPLYEQQPMAASHMPQSFKRHFSKQESDDLSPLKCCVRLPETPIKGFDLGKEDLLFSDTPVQSARALVRELKELEEKKPEITQAKWRKQVISRLPKLFDTLLFFFQSTKRTVITKELLVNMIISNELEIVDPREVDEQLRLLQELAPEWIYEKIASNGDFLCCTAATEIRSETVGFL
ncbi:hypothetical protein L1987_63862 [Smallanthus sonchifolius]|uniref:Uncharacterized protein n=1 Tax=Smallanthus sonchifolius TaxID=185202 RepID=A0ACB9CEH6_9ASTR|nr:hypothetical protein L1987_63862 [Smallanthus sonchifolius]